MYTTFAACQPYPLDALNDDDRHHCFLKFANNKDINMVSAILRHMAWYFYRVGVNTPFDNN